MPEHSRTLLTTGEIAKMCGVSNRVVRFYQDKGLLIPAHVDEETGNRYYDYSQIVTLESIRHLQNVGFSLDEIADITASQDMVGLERAAERRLGEIEAQRRELDIARWTTERLLASCRLMEHPPMLDQIMLENLPARPILAFDVSSGTKDANDSPGSPDTKADSSSLRGWLNVTAGVKRAMIERGHPLSFYERIGCTVSKESFLNKNPQVKQAIIMVDEEEGSRVDGARLPAGPHLTIFSSHGYTANGTTNPSDTDYLVRMADYAEAKGMEVTGDPFEEVLSSYPFRFHKQGDALYRICVPVMR